MIGAVAFDVDGTLIDSMQLHVDSWSWAFAQHGYDISEDRLKTQFGRRADFFVRHFVPELDELSVKRIVDTKRAFYRTQMEGITLISGARELLEGMKRCSIKVGLATSASRTELNYYVQRFRLDRLIDADISGDEISESKPNPEILEKIFDRLGVAASSSVYVGDSPHDVSAALAVGAAPIAVLTGGYLKELLESAGAAVVLESVADLTPEFLSGEEWIVTGG